MAWVRERHFDVLEAAFVKVDATESVAAIQHLLRERPELKLVVVEFQPAAGSPWAHGRVAPAKPSWFLAKAGDVKHFDLAAGDRPISLLPQLLAEAVVLDQHQQGIGEARWKASRVRSRVVVLTNEGVFRGLVGEPDNALSRGSDADAVEARFLRAKVEAGGKIMVDSFKPDVSHTLKLSVGPAEAGLLITETAVPAETPTGGMLTITVVGPAWASGTGQIFLPPAGASSEFVLDLGVPPPGVHRLTIIVMSEMGLVQTATLVGECTADTPQGPLALLVDQSLWPGPGEPMPTLVTDADQVVAVAPSDEDQGVNVSGLVRDLDAVSREFMEIADYELQDLWEDSGSLEESVGLLRSFARDGAAMYQDLMFSLPETLRGDFAGDGPVRLIVRDPSTDLPAEIFYDLPRPTKNATLCAGALAALNSGNCAACTATPSNEHVCPMGFWGLRRVIERRVIEPDVMGTQPLRLASPHTRDTADRPQLAPLRRALVASSERVKTEFSRPLVDALKENKMDPLGASDWDEWSHFITDEADPPTLLIAMPHVDQDSTVPFMEIGGSTLDRADMSSKHVRHDAADSSQTGPIVLLIGCETGSARLHHRTMTSRFLNHGAAIVLGTRMPVIADFAPQIAATLVRALAEPGQAHFGEALRVTRCKLVSQGRLIALALVAIGDGGWQLQPRGAA